MSTKDLPVTTFSECEALNGLRHSGYGPLHQDSSGPREVRIVKDPTRNENILSMRGKTHKPGDECH